MTDLPTSKTELLEQMEAGRSKWNDVLAQIDSSALEEPGIEGVWSIKQIIAHILGYEEWALALLTDLHESSAGARPAFDSFWQEQLDAYRQDHPDFPARMNETDDDQTNAVVVTYFDRFSAREVLERERQVYQQLLTATKALVDTRFLEPWRDGARPLIAILPNQSYGHYETHLPAIQKWLTESTE
jgi:uncharacterized damage-inducible protein DinB